MILLGLNDSETEKLRLSCMEKANQKDKAAGGDDDEGDDTGIERHCDTLLMCMITSMNEGLRNGGGIGDVLRKPSSGVRN